jgi:hypothetical protein
VSPHRSKAYEAALKQKAVYWGNPVSTGAGKRTFDAAVEVDVRWEVRKELFLDADGEEQTSRAVVTVAQDVDLGGYLYLGELDDLSSGEQADPLSFEAAWEVRGFDKSPDLKAAGHYRRVML